VGLLAVNRARGSSDWLGGWSQDAGLCPSADVDDVTADTNGSAFHAFTHCHWTTVHCWAHGGQ